MPNLTHSAHEVQSNSIRIRPIYLCLPGYLHLDQTREAHPSLVFRQRRGPRNLKPKSPEDCPQCNCDSTLLAHRPKLDVLPWSERKSHRGRPKVVDTSGHASLNPSCDYFAIADTAIHALVSNGRRGKQRIRYFKCQACGGWRTCRFGTPRTMQKLGSNPPARENQKLRPF